MSNKLYFVCKYVKKTIDVIDCKMLGIGIFNYFNLLNYEWNDTCNNKKQKLSFIPSTSKIMSGEKTCFVSRYRDCEISSESRVRSRLFTCSVNQAQGLVFAISTLFPSFFLILFLYALELSPQPSIPNLLILTIII